MFFENLLIFTGILQHFRHIVDRFHGILDPNLKIKTILLKLKKSKIRSSLFINPSIKDIKLSKKLNSDCVELHTGKISNLIKLKKDFSNEFKKIKNCARYGNSL